MTRLLAAAACFPLTLLSATAVVDGGETLRMQVSPRVSRAPALLTVRVHVDAQADGRFLQVTAESADFYRSSEIPFDGRNRSNLKVFEFRDLPSGTYEVTGMLVGVNGLHAKVARTAQVVPSVGSR